MSGRRFGESNELHQIDARIVSRTNGELHTTSLDPSGNMCDCDGWRYSRSCWHVNFLLEVLQKAGGVLVEDDEPAPDLFPELSKPAPRVRVAQEEVDWANRHEPIEEFPW